MQGKNPYNILGVSKNASGNNIEKAFVALLVAKVNVVCGVVTLLLIAPKLMYYQFVILMMNQDLKELLLIID